MEKEQSHEIKLFTYGTLMPDGRNYRRIAPYVVGAKPGTIMGRMVSIGGMYPGIIQGRGIVKGVVLTLQADGGYDEYFKRPINVQTDVLDFIEGYNPQARCCNYLRRPVLVNCPDGLELAQVYWYSGGGKYDGDPLTEINFRRYPLLVTGHENGMPVFEWKNQGQRMVV
jgi:gamma-glutamylcyclotransferase (GGCT)/AIG2-like uncharacterized protein YtfP